MEHLPNLSVAALSCYCIVLQIVFVGMLIGSNVWGSFSDKYGRRPVSEYINTGAILEITDS